MSKRLKGFIVAHHATVVLLPKLRHLGEGDVAEKLNKFGFKFSRVACEDHATKVENNIYVVAHNCTKIVKKSESAKGEGEKGEEA